MSNKLPTVLIVEDNIDLAEGLAEYLEANGYIVDFAYRGDNAISLISANVYDLILLDINLPSLNGIEVCRQLKNKEIAHTPVLMMTAKTDLDDKLKAFDAGAWDYLTKPFSFRELMARINALTARNNITVQKEIECGNLILNVSTEQISCSFKPLKLQRSLHVLLKRLVESSPDLVSNSELSNLLWGDQVPSSDPLRAQIYKLRKALKEIDSGCQVITTKGRGYSIETTF